MRVDIETLLTATFTLVHPQTEGDLSITLWCRNQKTDITIFRYILSISTVVGNQFIA